MPDPSTQVERNVSAHRSPVVGEPSALLEYFEVDDSVELIRTQVPSSLRGRRCGATLTHAAPLYARHADLNVDRMCACASVCRYFVHRSEYACSVHSSVQELTVPRL